MKRVVVLACIVMASIVASTWTSLNAQQPAAAQGREGGAGRGAAPGVGAAQKVAANLFMIPVPAGTPRLRHGQRRRAGRYQAGQ
jgi:hypothetical protein